MFESNTAAGREDGCNVHTQQGTTSETGVERVDHNKEGGREGGRECLREGRREGGREGGREREREREIERERGGEGDGGIKREKVREQDTHTENMIAAMLFQQSG